MNEVNFITFKVGDFKTTEEFYDTLFRQIRLLIETHQVFSFHQHPSQKGHFVLQFAPDGEEANTFPIWLNNEEITQIMNFNRLKKYSSAKDFVDKFEKSIQIETVDLNDVDDDFGNLEKPKKDKKKKKDDGDKGDA